MKQYLDIRRFEGESARIADEDKPGYVFQKVENLRPSVKMGSLVKRDPYSDVSTLSITSFQTMKEFKDGNGEATLALIDNDAFEAYANTHGEYATQSFTDNNDGTIDGDNTELIAFNNELRGGVGTRTAGNGDKPIWYGYIDATTRFPNGGDPISISADEYLEEQFPQSPITGTLVRTDAHSYAVAQTAVTGKGIDADSSIRVYLAPVYDGYQRGIPEFFHTFKLADYISAITFRIEIAEANESALSRITDIDVFVAEIPIDSDVSDTTPYPAYFLERIPLDDDGEPFLHFESTAVTLDDTLNDEKITVADYADWKTFNSSGSSAYLWIHDKTNDEYYMITGATINGDDVEFATTPVCADTGAAEIEIFSRWYKSGGYHGYAVLYDNHHRKLGSEMYEYLNIPVGDEGISNFKYKYVAWNGDHALYGGGTDTSHTYFSVVKRPDIVPSLNVNRHKATVRALSNIGQDFLIYTDKGVERLRISGNTESYKDEEYSNVVIVSNKAKAKVDDDTEVFMSYNGPVLIQGGSIETDIGWHLREWWLDTFTQAQLEACVVGYNFKEEEVWFSFPTYTTSPYGAGIIFVLDLKAYKEGYVSPWWRVKSDATVKGFEVNSQYNMIAGNTYGTDKIVDFNTAGTGEDVGTALKIKVLENPKAGGKVRFDRIYLDYDGSDVTPNCYIDGSGTAADNVTALNDDGCSFLREIGKTLEVDLISGSDTDDLEYKKLQVSYKPLRK